MSELAIARKFYRAKRAGNLDEDSPIQVQMADFSIFVNSRDYNASSKIRILSLSPSVFVHLHLSYEKYSAGNSPVICLRVIAIDLILL